MSDTVITFEALAAGEQDIRTGYARLTATLHQLETDLAPMLATWSGAAQEAYLGCKRQWDTGASALADVLATIGSAVGQAHTDYLAAEASARSNWI